MLKGCSRNSCLRNCCLEFKDTFDNNLEIEYDFVKYLNESCCNVLINISPSSIFLIMLLPARYPQNCQALLAAVSINRLKTSQTIRLYDYINGNINMPAVTLVLLQDFCGLA